MNELTHTTQTLLCHHILIHQIFFQSLHVHSFHVLKWWSMKKS